MVILVRKFLLLNLKIVPPILNNSSVPKFKFAVRLLKSGIYIYFFLVHRTRICSQISDLVPSLLSQALERDIEARYLSVLVKCGIWRFFGVQNINLESNFRFSASSHLWSCRVRYSNFYEVTFCQLFFVKVLQKSLSFDLRNRLQFLKFIIIGGLFFHYVLIKKVKGTLRSPVFNSNGFHSIPE